MPALPSLLAGPFPLPPAELYGFTFEWFGGLTALAVVVGVIVAHVRARALGISEQVVTHISIISVVAGFTGSHLVYAIAYAPQTIAEDPLYLLKIWAGMSNVGGWLGGYVGVWLYFVWRRGLPFLPYADAIAYGLAFAWIFGRLGCLVSFDHPGVETDFFLGMEYPGSASLSAGVRHNIGLYELLWCLSISAYFFSQRRKPKLTGWYMTTFVLAYAPFRFPVDFLRAVDVRYAGLSPGQWILIGFFAVLAGVAVHISRRGELLIPDGVPKPAFYPGGVVTEDLGPEGDLGPEEDRG